jgi:hypothetical protein
MEHLWESEVVSDGRRASVPVPRKKGTGRTPLRLQEIEDRKAIATLRWQGKTSRRESAAWFRMSIDGGEHGIMACQKALSNMRATY